MNQMVSKVTLLILCYSTLSFNFLKAETIKAKSLAEALHREYADIQEGEGEIRYIEAYYDLNGDGKEEAIIYAYGPTICGSGGCETLIFSQDKAGFRLITSISISRPPIIVMSSTKNGWRNLAVFVAGGGIIPGYFAQLQFDGKSYPENPSVEPARQLNNKPEGKVVIEKVSSFSEGKVLKAKS